MHQFYVVEKVKRPLVVVYVTGQGYNVAAEPANSLNQSQLLVVGRDKSYGGDRAVFVFINCR